MVGSSFAMGYRVQREKTFGALLPSELSTRTGRRAELYNESMAGSGGSPRSVSLRFKDALMAKPDMILWILTFWDISHVSTIMPDDARPIGHGTAMGRTRRLVTEGLAGKSIPEMLNDLSHVLQSAVRVRWDTTRSCFLLRHFLNKSQSQYLKSYLMESDSDDGFLQIRICKADGLEHCASRGAIPSLGDRIALKFHGVNFYSLTLRGRGI